MFMVLVGSAAAVLVSSTHTAAFRTISCLRELIPGLRVLGKKTRDMEGERDRLSNLWREGKRAQALEVADKSQHKAIKHMAELILNRSPEAASAKAFLELRHDEISTWQ